MSPSTIFTQFNDQAFLLYSTKTFEIYDIRKARTAQNTLASEILQGLTPQDPSVMKSIPTVVLYDERGLQLFDKITFLDEYYLTNCELDILSRKVDEIVYHIKNGSIIVELGAGSLRKTQLILNSLERNRKEVIYCALDLMEDELKKSLSSLGQYTNIKLVGLLGTYEEGMDLVSGFSPDTPRTIMWLGSSVGNLNREDATSFIQAFQKKAMNVSDLFLVGIDRRNDPQKVTIAYNDPRGITAEFIMNGLDHVNVILGGQSFIDRNKFEYFARYNEVQGRHEAYYKAKMDHSLKYIAPDTQKKTVIYLKKGELIHIEYSYKYNLMETLKLVHNSELSLIKSWPDSQLQYDLHLCQRSPFFLNRLQHSAVPSVEEWEELWKSWDTITMSMVSKDMQLEKPISLRHPFLFYFGHIPAFLDIHLSRFFKEKLTEPDSFADIFERGIDPDIEDSTKCNPHSIVPNEWPELNTVIGFRDRVRERLRKVYASRGENISRSLGRILWMTFEHEALHLETILYMLVQSPNALPPRGVITPNWQTAEYHAPEAQLIAIPSQTVILGHNDHESSDESDPLDLPFGWDNERPARQVEVQAFKIQSRPITNREYLLFLEAKNVENNDCPASWVRVDNTYKVRTVFGPVEMSIAKNWPIMLSHRQLSKYAEWRGMRLPTEAEMRLFYNLYTRQLDLSSNIGFAHWHPVDVPLGAGQVQTLGSVWEWTNTVFGEYTGFEKSKLYPGYSFDFFDGKHAVVLGGSWATHPTISARKTFRNFYQHGYPYMFAGGRLCEI